MVVFYIVPVYLILALIIIIIGGIYQIATGIYMILAVVGTIVGIIAGGYAVVIAFSKTFSTKRIYLIIPGVLFLAFGVGAISIFRQSFCLSEKWSQWSGRGTLMIHSNAVFRWAILATLIISLCFAIFFYLSCNTEKTMVSFLFSVISCLILIVPLFITHSYCEQEYYEKNSTSYEQVYTVKEDVNVKLYVNESYRGSSLNVTGEYDIIRRIFPKTFKKGETVYGETYDSGNIEVFNEKNVIGDVPSEYLEPQ